LIIINLTGKSSYFRLDQVLKQQHQSNEDRKASVISPLHQLALSSI